MSSRVNVLADALGQLIDGIELLARGHGGEDVGLVAGEGIYRGAAGSEHRGWVALHERPEGRTRVPERGVPGGGAVRQVERRDQVTTDAELLHHLLVPITPGYLDVEVHEALIANGLDVPGVGLVQSLSPAVTLRKVVPVAQEPAEHERQRDASLGWFGVDELRERSLWAGCRGLEVGRIGAQVGVRPDLALADERVADLQVEGQAEDLNLYVAVGDTGFERDGDLRERSTGGTEGVVATPEDKPVPVCAAELEGELRGHGMILPQTPGNPMERRALLQCRASCVAPGCKALNQPKWCEKYS